MNKQEEKIQEEIIRRVLERSAFNEQKKLKQLQTQSTLDSLCEMTGLPREELEKIAEDVRTSHVPDKKDFFSIKNQIFMVIIIGVILFSLFVLLMWLF